MTEATQVDINTRLRNVQVALKAPKSQRNNFGNYNYRSCEDILEALKPLLDTQELTLVISDEIQLIGDRYYVMAIARVTWEDKFVSVTAYAREEDTKKGMDGSQITCAASSYARKYALNGLFAIDDTKDADSQDNRSSTPPKVVPKPVEPTVRLATDVQKAQIKAFANALGIAEENLARELHDKYGVRNPAKMTYDEAVKAMEAMK